MAVLISLNDNAAGDGFLLAPLDSTYEATIKLKTDPATPTATVTLQASPNVAGLVFSTVGPITITPVETIVTVHAMMQSSSRGDTTIQVLEGAVVAASFAVTSIRNPTINFKGRFEVRFATDNNWFNSNPQYTAAVDVIPAPRGWTWALEGEPPFVPAAAVPENLDTPGLGRAIRLNNPISLRSHAAPVVSTVNSISGQTASGTEVFTTGDALIGQPVDFGPDTYFAGNYTGDPLNPFKPGDPTPEEFWNAGEEPMALFQFKLGNPSLYFRGKSTVGPFVAKSTTVDTHTRTPDRRPIANGIVQVPAAEMTEFGLPDVVTFSETRIDLLLLDWDALPAGDSTTRRNLRRRISHLLGAVSTTKRAAVQAAYPATFNVRGGTLTVDFDGGGPIAPNWDFREVYTGKVDTDLHALPGGSSVVDYLRQYFSFDFVWRPFAFHSDELCGHHKGTFKGTPMMTGNHIGDPHVKTVNGISYDFQGVGEFTLLKDGNRMEVQVRQTPVAAANPVTDGHSGLTACVSLNTAVGIRVGSHRIAYQPGPGREKRLQFFVDGKPAQLPTQGQGLNLNGHWVTTFDANGETGLRVYYQDQSVVTVTPAFWNPYNIWYMNVSVTNTLASEGIMGHIPGKSWLPRLRNGEDVGPKPASLQDRYNMLYKTFADSWRVKDSTSLFVYAAGTSTKTFTDPDWPALQAPCKMKPEFEIPGAPILEGMPIEKAEQVCKLVTDDDLHKHCVFDVATTGDESFAKTYLFEQELRRNSTKVDIYAMDLPNNPDRKPVEPDQPPIKGPLGKLIKATVTSTVPDSPAPKGKLVFYADDKAVGDAVPLDARGRARWKVKGLDKGTHYIRAVYIPEDNKVSHGSSSAIVKLELTKSTIDNKDEGTKPDTNGDGGANNSGGLFGRWYIWVILILLILLIWCFFMKN